MFRRSLLLPLGWFVLVTGCGPSTGVIQGTVTFNGRPLERGLATAVPVGPGGTTEGAEITAGRFEIKNLQFGEYQIHVEAVRPEPKMVNPGSPESQRKLSDEEIRTLADPLPADTAGKDQTVTVKSGEQTVEFKLTSATEQ